MAEQLYINTDVLGDETYAGTWDEWRAKLGPNLEQGYRQYKNGLAEGLRLGELEDHDAVPVSFDAWALGVMEECIVPVDEGRKNKYKRLKK